MNKYKRSNKDALVELKVRFNRKNKQLPANQVARM